MLENTKTVTVNGKQREILMSFNLLSRIAKSVGGLDGLSLLIHDEQVQADYLVAILSERDEAGKLLSIPKIEDIVMSPEEAGELMKWALGHLTGFFLSWNSAVAEKLVESQKKLDQTNQLLVPNRPSLPDGVKG